MNKFISKTTKKRFPPTPIRFLSFVLMFAMIISTLMPFASAVGTNTDAVEIAAWSYYGNDGILKSSIPANSGANKDGASISASGGRNLYFYSNGISVSGGWNIGAYWLLNLSTKGFEDMTISFMLRHESATQGARWFEFDYSLDGDNWTHYPESGSIRADHSGTQSMFATNSPFIKFKLPRELDNKDKVYIRLRAIRHEGIFAISPGSRNDINNIYITGSAVQEITTHTITFDTNGSTVKIPAVTVNEGETVAKPTTRPTMGFGTTAVPFMGWYLDDTAFDFNTPITEDITLTAKYMAHATANLPHRTAIKAGTEIVIFNNTPGAKIEYRIGDASPVVWLEYTEPFSIENFYHGGGTQIAPYFCNIYVRTVFVDDLGVTRTLSGFAEINNSRGPYTYYELNTLTFDPDNGDNVIMVDVLNTFTITQNQTSAWYLPEYTAGQIPADPVKEGYDFITWTLNGEVFDFETRITEDITLVAAWEAVPVVIISASTTANDFVSMTETAKGSRVWELTFNVVLAYSDGTTSDKMVTIELNGNNSNLDGKYTFGNEHDLAGYTLVYDIKGNGSNIKSFELIK